MIGAQGLGALGDRTKRAVRHQVPELVMDPGIENPKTRPNPTRIFTTRARPEPEI